VREVTSPWFGEPTYYQRSNSITPPSPGGVEEIGKPELGTKPGDQLYIHPSRVVRLVGLDYPDWERAPDCWGDSVLQPVADALRSAGMVSGSFATMIAEAKVDVIKVPGLTAKMQTEDGTTTLFNRFSKANVGKSVINALLIDKDEEWERMQLHLEAMDKVLLSYFMICCAAADVPATRFMGREPAGMNASGDSDTRNYYDRLASDQKVRITPAMSRLDEVIIRSSLGSRDEAIDYHWKTLWLKSDTEKADEELKKAQAHQIDVNSGLISPHVLQTGRQNSLIESGYLYPGIEQAIDEEGEWDAEEGVDNARAGGMEDPNDPDNIEQAAKIAKKHGPIDPNDPKTISAKAKAAAANKPPPGKPNGGGKPSSQGR
jgi:phage-related protein (TIGR01555 family)